MARDGFVLDAFTLERKHQQVKTAASNTDNTADYEISVLSRVHIDELRTQADDRAMAGLQGPRARCEPLGGTIADGLDCKGLRLHSGDVVFRGSSPLFVSGAIHLHEGEFQLFVQSFSLVRRLFPMAAEWKQQPGIYRCGLQGIRPAACWALDGLTFTILGG